MFYKIENNKLKLQKYNKLIPQQRQTRHSNT